MIIQQTRIRKVNAHLAHIEDDESFYIAISDLKNTSKKLTKIGFTKEQEVGETILPRAVGNISKFNAYGKYIKYTDQPMVTDYYQREWTWTDWGGYEHSRIVDVPYERYPRDFVSPPSEELRIAEIDGKHYLISRELTKKKDGEAVKHIINLFLELFGYCIVLNKDYETFSIPEVKRLNWEILPQGEYPWEEVKDRVEHNIREAPEGKRPVIEHRIQKITEHSPNYLAIGKGGFSGYWVFGFPNKDIYILENSNYGNATYVFGSNWEELSQLTKKEILSGDLQEKRIIHREGWEEEVDTLFN